MPFRFVFSLLFLSLFLLFSTGCHHGRSGKSKITQSSAIYSPQRFSDDLLDSTYIQDQIKGDSSLKPYADEILAFYERRHFEAAWLQRDTLTLSAYDFLNTLQNYEGMYGDKTVAAGLSSADIGAMLLSVSPQAFSTLDLRITEAFFKYAQKEYVGSAADPRDLEWYIPRMKKDYQTLLDSLVVSPAGYSIYEPVNPYYRSLKKILVQYRALERKGGWPVVTSSSLPLKIGDSTTTIAQLKQSLTLMGDYTDADKGPLYTDTFAMAVKGYQQRLGLRETGQIDSLTLSEINAPISSRIRQIMLNMERLRWVPDSLPPDYLLVNIPEYRIHIYEHGEVSWSMNVVVGEAATQTSIFMGRLSVVDFCPYWNVPVSIIKNEILPALKRNPGYLEHANMEAVRNGTVLNGYAINCHQYKTSVPFDIRQKPGPQNSLGLVAFFFPNSFDIYLHDTPAKSFFNESTRAFSHGCIRLADPPRLADYVFRNDSTMPPSRIRQLMNAHVERKFPVRPSIPVYITYFTAWVDNAGRVNFRHDIYGHDEKLAKEIFGK